MRYARLTKDWLLRGWTDEPWTIINWTNGSCRKLSAEWFETAKACDGLTDFDNIDGVLQQNIRLSKLINAGLAEECEQGEGIQPYQRFIQADNPYIRSIHWSITGHCNLKCRHCYMQSPDGRYGELPLPDMLGIIEQLAAANVHLVELTGGEPFMRTDLLDILAALVAKQINVLRIYSNGTLITDDILLEIKKLGLFPAIQISFDGCGAHDAMRGIVNAETATIEAIQRLNSQGFPVIVATSIDRTNIHTLDITYTLLKELGIRFWRVAAPQKIGNWRTTTTSLSPEERLSACAPIAARWLKDGKPFALQLPGYRSTEDEKAPVRYTPESYDCMSCRICCSLLPDGTVLPCATYTDTVIYEKMPNLLRESFAGIWSDSALRKIIDIKKSEVLAHNSQCTTCKEFNRCGGGCRATSAVATGDLLTVDPQLCELYKSKFQQRFSVLAGLSAAAASSNPK
ncbi:radical SAM/SPASM domain-containing protein [uncultured Anaeromusa sp.]|uniref:radical SAM/SPASM domain-containing protein n=1 Tax=uncultured Anaeromusa sp. TaxID=673273 RepID=UPI0029C6B213|nr:radical SAM protein [uncultured Anaeromusa sp.]